VVDLQDDGASWGSGRAHLGEQILWNDASRFWGLGIASQRECVEVTEVDVDGGDLVPDNRRELAL
jgi:hypothetical protein